MAVAVSSEKGTVKKAGSEAGRQRQGRQAAGEAAAYGSGVCIQWAGRQGGRQVQSAGAGVMRVSAAKPKRQSRTKV